MSKIFAVFCLLILSTTSLAEDTLVQKSDNDILKDYVKWDQPQFYRHERRKQITEVHLKGALKKGLHINILLDNTYFVGRDKSFRPLRFKRRKSIRIKPDNEGNFEYRINLPQKEIHFAFEIELPNAENVGGVLIIKVPKAKVTEWESFLSEGWKKPIDEPVYESFWRIGIGVGMTYFDYEDADNETGLTYKFNKAIDPSPSLLVNYFATEYSQFEIQYDNLQIGKLEDTNLNFIGDKNFFWHRANFNWLYEWGQFKFWGTDISFSPILGAQHHNTSYINQTSTTEAFVETSSLSNLSFGARLQMFNSNFLYTATLRYHLPASSPAGYRIQPDFNFDGYLQASYGINDRHWIVLRWFGQWVKNKITFNNKSTVSEFTGLQDLFFTNMTLYYQYEF